MAFREDVPLAGGERRGTWWERNSSHIVSVTGTVSVALLACVVTLSAELHSTHSDIGLFNAGQPPVSAEIKQMAATARMLGQPSSEKPLSGYSSTIFSTGVDAFGDKLAAGADDPHWIDGVTKQPLTVMEPHTRWITSAHAGWVNSAGASTSDNIPKGTYVMEARFTIASEDSQIALNFGADDTLLNIELNDLKNYDCPYGHYSYLTTCVMGKSNGLKMGENVLKLGYSNLGKFDNPGGGIVVAKEIFGLVADEKPQGTGVFWDEDYNLDTQMPGEAETYWVNLDQPDVKPTVMAPEASWYKGDSDAAGSWVGPDLEPETTNEKLLKKMGLNTEEYQPQAFHYAHYFHTKSKTCEVAANLAVSGMIETVHVNGKKLPVHYTESQTPKTLQLTAAHGLEPGMNMIKVDWKSVEGQNPALYVDFEDFACPAVEKFQVVPNGIITNTEFYNQVCVFQQRWGYNNGCNFCLPTDMNKGFDWMQDELDFALEICEEWFLLRSEYMGCDEQDAKDALYDCRNYNLGIFDSMYTCGCEGQLGGVPDWATSFNL